MWPLWDFSGSLTLFWASLVAQVVKNLPAMQKAWAQSLSWEDPLEKGMATHFSILAWRIPWTEETGGLQSMGLQRVRHNWATKCAVGDFSGSPLGKPLCFKSRECRFDPWVGKILQRSNWLPTLVFLGIPGGSEGKESTCSVGDLGSIPGLERSPGGRA